MRYLCSNDGRSHFLSYLFERKQNKIIWYAGIKKRDNNNKSLINRDFFDFAVILYDFD